MSWGTYQDSLCHPDQFHCNAHSNNICVLKEGTVSDKILSFLDLDMAFTSEKHCNLKTGVVGLKKEEEEKLFRFEMVNLMEVLAGGDASTGVPMVARREVDSRHGVVVLVENALTDLLIRGFIEGYEGDECPTSAKFDKELHVGAYGLVKLAIIKQAEFAA